MDDSLKVYTIIVFATHINRYFVDTNLKNFKRPPFFVFLSLCFSVNLEIIHPFPSHSMSLKNFIHVAVQLSLCTTFRII